MVNQRIGKDLEPIMQASRTLQAGDFPPASASRELIWAFASFPLAVLIIGCAGFPAANGGSLYKRLGGIAQIEAIVDESVRRAIADSGSNVEPAPRVLPALRQSVVAQVCVRAGGPCGPAESTTVAAKMTAAEFEAFVGSMRAVLDRRVGEREKNELLRLLAPIRREVVGA